MAREWKTIDASVLPPAQANHRVSAETMSQPLDSDFTPLLCCVSLALVRAPAALTE
jgi:hypothetical protein